MKGIIKVALAIVIIAIIVGSCYIFWPKSGPELETVTYPESVLNWAEAVKSKYGNTTLKIAAITHPATDAFKKMIPYFENLTGIKVTMSEMDETIYYEKLNLWAVKGIPYDCIYAAAEAVPTLVMMKQIISLDDFIANQSLTPEWFNFSDIVPAYRDTMSYQGKTYGIPFAGETILVMYRKDLFEQYGKTPPETYEELLDLAEFFDGITVDGKSISGVSIRAETGGQQNIWAWSSFLYGYNGSMITETLPYKPEFTKTETIDSLEYFIDLTKYGPPGIEGFSFPEAWTNFQMGKSAMLVEASAAAPGIEDPEKSLVAGKVGYAIFPRGPAGECAFVGGTGLTIPKTSEHKEAMWSLIVWLTSKYSSSRYLEYGGIAGRKSNFEEETYPYYKAILDTLNTAGNTSLSRKLRAFWGCTVSFYDIQVQVSTIMGLAQVGTMTPEQACYKMQEEVWKILKGS